MRERLPRWSVTRVWLEDPERAFREGKITQEDVAAYKAYMRYKEACQELCRPFVLNRDRNRCRACQAGNTPLVLAHVTPVWEFVKHRGDMAKMVDAYTEDNLVALCWPCHTAQHTPPGSAGEASYRARVELLFSSIARQRGWRSADDFYAQPQRAVSLVVRLAGRG